MKNKNMGALNKKEQQAKKQIIMLVGAIVVVILAVTIIMSFIKEEEIQKINVSKIVQNSETKILYIENSDSKKCNKCKEIKKYLDEEKINYLTYDVSLYTDKEYEDMLRTIEINPNDFGYPGVVYIKEGRLYANVINLEDTKPLKEFINNYELKKIK